MHFHGRDDMIEAHDYVDEHDPVNFYEHPYHGEAVHYHEAHVEDTNPDDHDAHHGPQLHDVGYGEHLRGYEHHDA